MRQQTKLLNFLTDYVLILFFLSIVGIAFFGAVGLTPKATNLNQVLGSATHSTNAIIPINVNSSEFVAQVIAASDSSTKFQLAIAQPSQEYYSLDLARLVNNFQYPKNFYVSAEIPEKYKSEVKYSIEVEGKEYIIFDSKLNEGIFDLEIKLEAEKETILKVKTHPYKNLGGFLEFNLEVSDSQLKQLP